MTKPEALMIVIKSLSVIPEDLKNKLIESIPHLSDEVVDQLGYELGMLKAYSIEQTQKTLDTVSAMLEEERKKDDTLAD